ncbi:MAG TPA: dihydropteroate synthase [Syntrophales bacterium]|nr:dihydropteroate synthase [Syntrophales bacterium]
MGIVNATPDSFSDGGRFTTSAEAVDEGMRLVEAGADILDVGGESTRPGSDPVTLEEELKRTMPVIGALANKVNVPISIDTTKAAVAREAINMGAEIINDVSAMRFDEKMPKVAADTGAGLILMHMRGLPKIMQTGSIVYQSLIDDIIAFLRERLQSAQSLGVEIDRAMIDPGIGFGKTAEDNMKILKHLGRFRALGRPILTGVSRKAFIGKVTGGEPRERLAGTAAAVVVSIMNGSSIVRVHDVETMKKVVDMTDAIMGS